MNTTEEAATICSNAEKALRELMQRAIADGEYRHLPTLARMAEQINQLSARVNQTVEVPSPTPDSVPSRSDRRPGRYRVKARRHVASDKHGSRRTPGVRSAKGGYPGFRRDGDNLVKIGWSKTSKTEYEHRAPKRIVEALLKAVVTAGQKGPMFTVEALLPLADASDGTEIPAYQVYLALAWLRTEGLVHQHGREGYSLLVTSNLEKTVEDRWNALPDKPATTEDKP
ncbi:MAG: hypothetical protein KKG09_07960 [Verrucomicrobia bacterium]|nr:hypothetical protein [Verrucomicrobiota bacterium]MBU4290177.1 hypothetical protein [Verrucomicrobiota bacterium]MBU4427772.1 hypothetical protein [Verrucomicrobiota bacterium]MBU4497923.1 hypothetical protein [Verrucomicrobiota bacterium]MCG2681689.1 hypothetical protein [Kiritimatiellia bacterium]